MLEEAAVAKTRGGEAWTPQYVVDLNHSSCIGCGRCYQVCPRDVFELIERSESDTIDKDDDLFDDDFFGEEGEMMVMNIANEMDCIGCMSCTRVCPKDCFSHSADPA